MLELAITEQAATLAHVLKQKALELRPRWWGAGRLWGGAPEQGRPMSAFGLTLRNFPRATDVAHALPSTTKGPIPHRQPAEAPREGFPQRN